MARARIVVWVALLLGLTGARVESALSFPLGSGPPSRFGVVRRAPWELSVPPLLAVQGVGPYPFVGSFQGWRWLEHVQQLAWNSGKESRYTFRVRGAVMLNNSPQPDDALDLAGDYILSVLRQYGYQVSVQPFRHARYADLTTKWAEFTMRNLIAQKPGAGPHRDRTLLLTAHYDSIASRSEGWDAQWRTMPAPGANDNASGVAMLLEIARLLAPVELDYSVAFVFFAGEELGRFGSKAFAERLAAEGTDLLGVVNLDMVGYDGDGQFDLHVVADANSEWMLQRIGVLARFWESPLEIFLHRNSEAHFSDQFSFWEVGYPGVLISEEPEPESAEWDPLYHTVNDRPDHVNPAYAELVGQFVLATVLTLARPLKAESSSPEPERPIAELAVYPNPYPQTAAKPMTIQYQLNQDAPVRVSIYALTGEEVAGWNFSAGGPRGRVGLNAPIQWVPRNRLGEPLGVGIYVLWVQVGEETQRSRWTKRLLIVPSERPLRKFQPERVRVGP